jgi:hypothetical protein
MDEATRYTAEYNAHEANMQVRALEREVAELKTRNDQKLFVMGEMAHTLRAIKRSWWYRIGKALHLCP